MALPVRSELRPGLRVQIVEKQNQGSGVLTEGVVARILTRSPSHPHGIKVMLEDGRVGRVKAIRPG
ncbi:MAG TPA: YwbE family protein [Anaerolineae bacterium]